MEALRILLIIVFVALVPVIMVVAAGIFSHIWRLTPEQMETARQRLRERRLVFGAMKRKFYD